MREKIKQFINSWKHGKLEKIQKDKIRNNLITVGVQINIKHYKEINLRTDK